MDQRRNAELAETDRRNTMYATQDPSDQIRDARYDELLKQMKQTQYKLKHTSDMQISDAELPALHAIPYFQVGSHASESRSQPGFESTNESYPDWHMITPAYDIDFAGMSGWELSKSLVLRGDKNNIWQRSKRWWNEKKAITYCDWLDKLAGGISFILLVYTMIVTIWSLHVGATVRYEVPGDDSGSSDMLNAVATNKGAKAAQAFLTGVSALIIAWNVFKRTTLPKGNPEIRGFSGRNKVAKKVRPVLNKMKQTFRAIVPINTGSAQVAVSTA